MQEEIWKDIPNYEGLYQVSNLGNVKSLPKEWLSGKNLIRKHNGKILSKSLNTSKYYCVCLIKNSNRKTFQIHQLVAMAFFGHKPCGYKLVIDHINDNQKDNRVENLQIVTHRFNVYKKQDNYSSKYKGVSWCNITKKWKSQIQINGIKKYLGLFDCELKAHLTYQNAIKQIK